MICYHASNTQFPCNQHFMMRKSPLFISSSPFAHLLSLLSPAHGFWLVNLVDIHSSRNKPINFIPNNYSLRCHHYIVCIHFICANSKVTKNKRQISIRPYDGKQIVKMKKEEKKLRIEGAKTEWLACLKFIGIHFACKRNVVHSNNE